MVKFQYFVICQGGVKAVDGVFENYISLLFFTSKFLIIMLRLIIISKFMSHAN